MSGTRKIYKGAVTSQHAVREVLTMVFAQELLAPSKEVFIVAPWISNIVVFDSQIGQYATLNPEWAKREIRLVEVLVAIAANGTTLHIHTRPDDHNKVFKRRMQDALGDAGLLDHRIRSLHAAKPHDARAGNLKAANLLVWLEERTHRELVVLGEPALNWHSQLTLKAL